MKLTKPQISYLEKARTGVLATVGLQKQMQRNLAEMGLIVRDRLGYYELTEAGMKALEEVL